MLICEPEDYLLFRHLGETGVPMVRHLAWFREPNKKVISSPSLSLALSFCRSCFSALDSSYGFQPFSSVVILRHRRFHNNTDTALFLDAPQSGPTINPRNKYRPSCTQKAEVRDYTYYVAILISLFGSGKRGFSSLPTMKKRTSQETPAPGWLYPNYIEITSSLSHPNFP
jgi:hypothetical protein